MLRGVWKSRWTSWASIPNKPTVSVDVKQHSSKYWSDNWWTMLFHYITSLSVVAVCHCITLFPERQTCLALSISHCVYGDFIIIWYYGIAVFTYVSQVGLKASSFTGVTFVAEYSFAASQRFRMIYFWGEWPNTGGYTISNAPKQCACKSRYSLLLRDLCWN